MNEMMVPFLRFSRLRNIYVLFVFFALIACLYSLLKPGILAPIYPAPKLTGALKRIKGLTLLSFKNKQLNKNSSDRMFSDLFRYTYTDGSEVSAVMVRVRKQGDFKIEAYGRLTKDIDQIYLINPMFNQSIPYSIVGLLKKKKAMQTCIIPDTTKLELVDVRLTPLSSTVKSASGNDRKGLWSKILGLEQKVDYACLVLTFSPSSKLNDPALFRTWNSMVAEVQKALAN